MRGISWLAARPVSFSRRTLLHGVTIGHLHFIVKPPEVCFAYMTDVGYVVFLLHCVSFLVDVYLGPCFVLVFYDTVPIYSRKQTQTQDNTDQRSNTIQYKNYVTNNCRMTSISNREQRSILQLPEDESCRSKHVVLADNLFLFSFT